MKIRSFVVTVVFVRQCGMFLTCLVLTRSLLCCRVNDVVVDVMHDLDLHGWSTVMNSVQH